MQKKVPAEHPDLYFVEDVCRLLGVSAPTLRKMRDQRRFTPRPFSYCNRLAWDRDEVDRFVAILPRELIKDRRGRRGYQIAA